MKKYKNIYVCNIGMAVRWGGQYIWQEKSPTLRAETGDNLPRIIAEVYDDSIYKKVQQRDGDGNGNSSNT